MDRMEHTAILGEEMRRCERELGALRTAGLEAELLGPRVLGARVSRVREFQQKVTPVVYSRRPTDASQRSARVFSVGGEEDNDGEEDADEDENCCEDFEDDAPPAVENRREFWKMVADRLEEAHIQSEDELRKYIFLLVVSGKFGKMDPRIREKFDALTDIVLKESLPYMNLLKTEPNPASMQQYGLAMVIVKEHRKLSGLRARMRQDMLTFVQFYERTAVSRNASRSSRQERDRYLRFFDYYADVCDLASANHTMGVKMTLQASGVDIMRCMLIAATHVAELVVVLGMSQRIAR